MGAGSTESRTKHLMEKTDIRGGEYALDDFHNSLCDVVAWNGDFLHPGRLPAHPLSTRNRSRADSGDSGPATFVKWS